MTQNDTYDPTETHRQRKANAALILRDRPHKQWNFAILGLPIATNEYSCAGVAELRRVNEPPTEIELARALQNKLIYGAIGRYASGIKHELAITMPFGQDSQPTMNLGWWIISALRVKTLAEFLIPAVADHSWSVIAALERDGCVATLIEDVPRAAPISDPNVPISESDFGWVFKNINVFATMLETPRFRLAVDSLTTHQHLVNQRMMAASLWAGIEALMGVESELRFRLALSVASLLEPRGPTRMQRYKTLKKLYDVRSKAVHGGQIEPTKLTSHVLQTRKILSELLVAMVEAGEVFSEESIERRMVE